MGNHSIFFLFFWAVSSAHFLKVEADTPSSLAAPRADSSPRCQAAWISGNSGGRAMGGRPNSTPPLLCRGNALCLPLADKFPFCLGHIA